MKKLLNRTLFYYALSAFLLLLITAPIYYWFSEKLYIEDVDEAIMLRKKEFFQRSLKTLQQSDIPTWNRFNRDIQILPVTNQSNDVILQQEFYDSLASENEPYRVLYTNVNLGEGEYTLMIRINLVESEDLVETTAFLYFIILMVLLSGFIIVSRIVTNHLWKPFYQTLSTIENFNIEAHQTPNFTNTRTKEFQQLNAALERLIKQNLKSFQLQKEFTENAAHELQTPLAVFQSKLDLLLQNTSISQEQSVIIQQLYDACSRLTRVNKNLLLLAKMENNQFAEKDKVSITKLINDVLPYFTEQAEEKHLQIISHLNEPFEINANRGLTEILINNLLLNAIRHNCDNGEIEIKTTHNSLIVSNSSDEKELREENVFKRFSKNTSFSTGSGLGLAIVKRIAELNNWEVFYSYSDNRHIFTVKF